MNQEGGEGTAHLAVVVLGEPYQQSLVGGRAEGVCVSACSSE